MENLHIPGVLFLDRLRILCRIYRSMKKEHKVLDRTSKAKAMNSAPVACLRTPLINTFKELIEDHTFFGLRLFAARDEKGIPQADCRVNGQDWEKGKESLQKYVETWPDVGYEFRKQYVVLQNDEKKS